MESIAFAGGLGSFQDVSGISDMFIVCVPDFSLGLMPGSSISTPANCSLPANTCPFARQFIQNSGQVEKGEGTSCPCVDFRLHPSCSFCRSYTCPSFFPVP